MSYNRLLWIIIEDFQLLQPRPFFLMDRTTGRRPDTTTHYIYNQVHNSNLLQSHCARGLILCGMHKRYCPDWVYQDARQLGHSPSSTASSLSNELSQPYQALQKINPFSNPDALRVKTSLPPHQRRYRRLVEISGSVRVRTKKEPNLTAENRLLRSSSGFDDFLEPDHGSVLSSHPAPSEPD